MMGEQNMDCPIKESGKRFIGAGLWGLTIMSET